MARKHDTSSTRPQPPQDLAERLFGIGFVPAPDLKAWALATFIEEGAPLRNDDHLHLQEANIGFLWASAGYHKRGCRILGQTEDLRQSRGNPWQTARAEQQLADWFGDVPDFLITLDGFFCRSCSDVELCALVEHELYHIAQETDEYGAPKFHRDTGRPKLGLRGHDVEEFIGVVRRYGIGEPDSALARLVIAAARGPDVAAVDIARACGTCLQRAA